MKAKLTKRYLFPLVKGSQFSIIITSNRVINGFVFFLKTTSGYLRVANYDNMVNRFLDQPIISKHGYGISAIERNAVEKANRYLDKQYDRLAKYLEIGDIERYTTLFELLRKKSDCFLLVMIVRKLPFYATNYSPHKIKYLIKEIRQLLKTESTNLKVKRVFLPELNSDGSIKKHRPLGVPTVQWRVISAMYEMYLVNILKKDWNERQFACIPGRGVSDAWIEILTYVDNAKHVTGIDLAKFFDSVYIKAARDSMLRNGIPNRVVKFLTDICYREPRVSPKDKQLERNRIKSLNTEVPKIGEFRDHKVWSENGNYKYTYRNRLDGNLYDLLTGLIVAPQEPQISNSRSVGLPQGLSTSPILACLVLGETNALLETHATEGDEHIIHYMDDAVLINSHEPNQLLLYTESLNSEQNGIQVSEKKTEIIKENGKWMKPLKFLGCQYDGQTFKAHTRKGGVFIVPDAKNKIDEIKVWLKEHKGDLKGYARTNLNRLISNGWNHVGDYMISDADKKDWSLWESHKIIITKLNTNSLEVQAVKKYIGMMNPIIGSLNTLTMLNAGYMLNFIAKNKVTNSGSPEQAKPDRLLWREILGITIFVLVSVSIIGLGMFAVR